MNYIGSKKKLIPFLYDVISANSKNLNESVFCDLFAGTGIVGSFFKDKTRQVISNDMEFYSYVLNRNSIQNNTKFTMPFTSLGQKEGFIFNNYCQEKSGRNYFTDENGKYIDWIREEIEEYRDDEDLYFFLLASLLEAADKVANTASVYGAFLKKIKPSASRIIEYTPIQPPAGNRGIVFNRDANSVIKDIEGDILFLDPPYNQRQYGANYHLLNTIAFNKAFEVKGVTGLPEYNKSLYSKIGDAVGALEDLIANAKFKYIYITYNNEGIIPFSIFEKVLSKFGKYSVFSVENYQRYKADKSRKYSADKTTEFIHFLHK